MSRVLSGDPSGKHVLIVDDLVQTGGTLIQCAKVCKLFTPCFEFECMYNYWHDECLCVCTYIFVNGLTWNRFYSVAHPWHTFRCSRLVEQIPLACLWLMECFLTSRGNSLLMKKEKSNLLISGSVTQFPTQLKYVVISLFNFYLCQMP